MSLILDAWRERGYAPAGDEQLLKDYEDKLQLERDKQSLIYALKYLPIPDQAPAPAPASPPLTGPSVGNITADSGTGTYEDPRTASGDGMTVRGSDSNDIPSWQINNAGNGLKLPGGAWYNNFGRSQTEAGNGTGVAAENGTEATPNEGDTNERYPAAGAVATDDNADVPGYRRASRAPALDAGLAETYQAQPRGIRNDVMVAAGRGYAGLGERNPATDGVRHAPSRATQANISSTGARWEPEPLLVNPATGLRDFKYSSQQALRAQAMGVADMLGRAFDGGSAPEEPSRAQQAVQAGVQAAAQAATDVVATPFDLLTAAGGAAYTAVTGNPADMPMFSSLGKAAQEGASTVELLNGLNPVYAGLVAAHDIKAGLAQGDVRPLAAFSGGLIASAALGRAIPHLPGYRPSTVSLISTAAQHLGAMGVPDWRVGLAPPRPGVLYSNPVPVVLEKIDASRKALPNKFPDNPRDFTEILGVLPTKVGLTPDGTQRVIWEPNANTRIRFESHPDGLQPDGAGFNPRHHGDHYHVELKPDGVSWNKASKSGLILKIEPLGYVPGSGKGFLPGEVFPGLK